MNYLIILNPTLKPIKLVEEMKWHTFLPKSLRVNAKHFCCYPCPLRNATGSHSSHLLPVKAAKFSYNSQLVVVVFFFSPGIDWRPVQGVPLPCATPEIEQA